MRGTPRLPLTSMTLEKKHWQANKLQGLVFPVGFKGYLREVFPAGVRQTQSSQHLKAGPGLCPPQRRSTSKVKIRRCKRTFLFCSFSLLLIDYLGKINPETILPVLYFN